MQLIHNWLENGRLEQLPHNFFLRRLPSILRRYVEKSEGPDFVEGVEFEFLDLLKINSTKYLLTLDNSPRLNSILTVFVDFASPGRHRGMSGLYVKHNSFEQR